MTALLLYRDDGPLAGVLARLGSRRVPALLPLLVAAVPMTVLLCADGARAPDGLLAGCAAWAVAFGGVSRGCDHGFRLAWLVPPALRGLEYGAVLGLAAATPAAAYALLAVAAFHHYDLIYRLRQRGETPPAWVSRAGGGWDGRLLVVCVLMLAGALPAALYVVAALLAVVLVGESVRGWVRFARAGHRVVEVEEEAAA
jgi:Family of unknown function (DUF5941)